jgi:hypothetical protein
MIRTAKVINTIAIITGSADGKGIGSGNIFLAMQPVVHVQTGSHLLHQEHYQQEADTLCYLLPVSHCGYKSKIFFATMIKLFFDQF